MECREGKEASILGSPNDYIDQKDAQTIAKHTKPTKLTFLRATNSTVTSVKENLGFKNKKAHHFI